MRKLIVAYRENDLFVKYMPEVFGLLSKEVTTEKFVYPAGTDVNWIREDIEAALKGEKGFVFLHDTTCEVFSEKTCEEREIQTYNLDEIFSYCATRAVRESFEYGSQTFVEDMERLARLIHDNPKSIFIVVDHIADHYMSSWLKLLEEDRREQADRNGLRAGEFSLALEKFFKEIFPTAKVTVVPIFTDAVKCCANNQDAMIVVDRHCDVMERDMDIDKWPHKAKLFMLPLENAASHLFTLKKLSVPFDAERVFEEISTIPVFDKWLNATPLLKFLQK